MTNSLGHLYSRRIAALATTRDAIVKDPVQNPHFQTFLARRARMWVSSTQPQDAILAVPEFSLPKENWRVVPFVPATEADKLSVYLKVLDKNRLGEEAVETPRHSPERAGGQIGPSEGERKNSGGSDLIEPTDHPVCGHRQSKKSIHENQGMSLRTPTIDAFMDGFVFEKNGSPTVPGNPGDENVVGSRTLPNSPQSSDAQLVDRRVTSLPKNSFDYIAQNANPSAIDQDELVERSELSQWGQEMLFYDHPKTNDSFTREPTLSLAHSAEYTGMLGEFILPLVSKSILAWFDEVGRDEHGYLNPDPRVWRLSLEPVSCEDSFKIRRGSDDSACATSF
jgi:hypothetical protein